MNSDGFVSRNQSNQLRLVRAHSVQTIPDVASQVGIPLTPDKLVGPTTRLVFLAKYPHRPC